MIRSYIIFCAFVASVPFLSERVVTAQSPTIQDDPLSNRIVAYDIRARLDPDEKTVHGAQRVTWRNPDQVPVEELQFHLYLNAFRNENSTFMKESRGAHRGNSAQSEDPWGGMDIESMRIVHEGQSDRSALGQAGEQEGTDITESIRFIQPDDGNTEDMTVISVELPEPVAPGESITLDIDFTSRLPEIVARTGWKIKSNDSLFVMVAQWFPKLGVYEVPGQRYIPEDAPSGRWSTHQFHANSEFYADFGTYEVDISVPVHYKVGASGIRTNVEAEGGFKTVTYRAEDVHDFAWTASPDLLEFTDQWEHVQIRLLIQPEHEGQVQRHFEAAKVSLAYFDEWVGRYPYTTLTLVDGIGGSNGMEYPTLITCGTIYMMPSWLRFLELVTIHEFGHQYFYGMLASNEAEEAWLDEGINSYLETKIMDAEYGEGGLIDLPWIKVSDQEFQRVNYVDNNPGSAPIYNRSWEYASSTEYGKASYSKPATVLNTLEAYLGWELMQDILRTYYERWAFKHPTTRDFIEVVEDVSGEDLGWFFDQYIYGTATVDYAVDRIKVTELEQEGLFSNEVVLVRLEDGIMPVDVHVEFTDGTAEVISWAGQEEARVFDFVRETTVEEVIIDPRNEVLLDINMLNNRKRVEPETKFARHQVYNLTIVFQHLLQIAAGLF